MATATRRLEAVTEQTDATQIRPGYVAGTVIAAVFFSLGWIIGASWRGVVFCCIATRYGYRTGARITVAPAPPPG